MGNFQSVLNQITIQNTQLSSTNQTCTQSASNTISDVTINAIGSHLGNISIYNDLTVDNMDCVLTALDANAISNKASNEASQTIQTLPWNFNVNHSAIRNTAELYSYQQAVISQQCVQTTSDDVKNVSLLFVDTVTGNITISDRSTIGGLSCNLSSSIYQQITNDASNKATQKTSVGCCGFDCAMMIPILLGVVVLVVIMKTLGKTPYSSKNSDGADDIREATAVLELAKATATPTSTSTSTPTPASRQPARL